MTDKQTVEETYSRHFSHNFVSQYLHDRVLAFVLTPSIGNAL